MCLFDGPIDIGVDDDVAVDLLATLRGGRIQQRRPGHAQATAVAGEVTVSDPSEPAGDRGRTGSSGRRWPSSKGTWP
jgi:hypothetical protein